MRGVSFIWNWGTGNLKSIRFFLIGFYIGWTLQGLTILDCMVHRSYLWICYLSLISLFQEVAVHMRVLAGKSHFWRARHSNDYNIPLGNAADSPVHTESLRCLSGLDWPTYRLRAAWFSSMQTSRIPQFSFLHHLVQPWINAKLDHSF